MADGITAQIQSVSQHVPHRTVNWYICRYQCTTKITLTHSWQTVYLKQIGGSGLEARYHSFR